ncbi:hypothetical protein OSTOST_16755 [Ostertagia ostertagi]
MQSELKISRQIIHLKYLDYNGIRELTNSLSTSMNAFYKNIPRRIYQKEETNALITYCDASKLAMTACTYLATHNDSNFLIAKSKSADYKHPITVPKMEMNAVAIGARLTMNTYLSLKTAIQVTKVILLSDSEIVLNWIKSSLRRQGTGQYVKNRVKEVHSIVKELQGMNISVQFGYIDTKQNPADIGTRGASAEELGSHIWWKAYSICNITESSIGSSLFNITPQDNNHEEKELEKTFMNALTTRTEKIKDLMDLSRYSCKRKALRVLAYAIMFLRNTIAHLRDPLRNKLQEHLTYLHARPQEKYLTATDIKQSHDALVRNHQKVHLRQQDKKDLLRNLNLMEDKDHLLRAHGRLNKSDLDEETKNPILVLPHTELAQECQRDNPLTSLPKNDKKKNND